MLPKLEHLLLQYKSGIKSCIYRLLEAVVPYHTIPITTSDYIYILTQPLRLIWFLNPVPRLHPEISSHSRSPESTVPPENTTLHQTEAYPLQRARKNSYI